MVVVVWLWVGCGATVLYADESERRKGAGGFPWFFLRAVRVRVRARARARARGRGRVRVRVLANHVILLHRIFEFGLHRFKVYPERCPAHPVLYACRSIWIPTARILRHRLCCGCRSCCPCAELIDSQLQRLLHLCPVWPRGLKGFFCRRLQGLFLYDRERLSLIITRKGEGEVGRDGGGKQVRLKEVRRVKAFRNNLPSNGNPKKECPKH